LIPQDVQTDAAVGVDVGVVDASSEVDLGRLEGIVGGEVDSKEEDTSRVWGVTLMLMLAFWTVIVSLWVFAEESYGPQQGPQRSDNGMRVAYRTHDGSLPVEL
jgi:hypothetical protein